MNNKGTILRLYKQTPQLFTIEVTLEAEIAAIRISKITTIIPLILISDLTQDVLQMPANIDLSYEGNDAYVIEVQSNGNVFLKCVSKIITSVKNNCSEI